MRPLPRTFLALLIGLAAPAAAAQDGPIAATEYGEVRGTTQRDVLVFKGIPYGADTAGRRFRPAEEPEPWDEVREATAYPDSAPQIGFSNPLFASWVPDPEPDASEDMLGLNVWTPALDDHRRPVMVWLHGGGFTAGSGSSRVFEGTNLARRGDVVVVTLNHRLNALGYLYLAELDERFADSGNVGNLDMVMALEWVRDNIAGFGGDPDRVLIFGESGGGRKVSSLLAMPAAEGLIDRAVVQSGSMLRANTAEEATRNARRLLKELDLAEDELDRLLELPAQEVVEAAMRISEEGVYWGPVVDGGALTEHPFDEGVAASALDVPMLIGTNDDELSLFFLADPTVFGIGFDEVAGRLDGYVPEGERERVVAAYRELFPDQDPTELLFTITTDRRYSENAVIQARLKAEAGGAPAWLYRFDWETPVMEGRLGAPHALEIPFAFDTVEASESMLGDPSAAQPLADKVSEAWIAFARHGDPNARGLPYWPRYDAETRPVMHLDDEPYVERGYFEREEAVVEGLPNQRMMAR